MKTEDPFQNSKHGDICPRCTRSVSVGDGKRIPRILSYYRLMCKSSRCLIHKKSVSSQTKAVIKNIKRKNLSGCKKKFFKPQTPARVNETNIAYRVDEFENEEKYNWEGIDPEMFAKIESTVIDCESCQEIKLVNIFGHPLLKEIINRTIIWPLNKPDIFKGLRSAPKGVLLFGPSGTGKTLIGRCIAFETTSTFFNISSSTFTSKWMGESEKLVRTMFAVAKARQPSVIFIDDVDSILSQRIPDENGSGRRMKNEFLMQMDESITKAEDRILVVGATNRPQELDDATRRRFVKRVYVPLPDEVSRRQFLRKLLERECHSLEEVDILDIVRKTEGYSFADLQNLGQEAAMEPIKSLPSDAISSLKPNKIRPISIDDFLSALELIKPSVSIDNLGTYKIWDSMYGYGGEFQRN